MKVRALGFTVSGRVLPATAARADSPASVLKGAARGGARTPVHVALRGAVCLIQCSRFGPARGDFPWFQVSIYKFR